MSTLSHNTAHRNIISLSLSAHLPQRHSLKPSLYGNWMVRSYRVVFTSWLADCGGSGWLCNLKYEFIFLVPFCFIFGDRRRFLIFFCVGYTRFEFCTRRAIVFILHLEPWCTACLKWQIFLFPVSLTQGLVESKVNFSVCSHLSLTNLNDVHWSCSTWPNESPSVSSQ